MVERVYRRLRASVRFQEFSKIALRVGAVGQESQIGLLGGVLQRRHPSLLFPRLRGLRGRRHLRLGQPGRALGSVVENAPAFAAASSLFIKAFSSVESSSLIFFSLALSASERLAPAFTNCW